RVMDEIDALAHRHAQMVHEFQRRGTGAAFIAVDHDEVGINPALDHRLADRQEFPAVADAHLESGGLAAGKISHIADKDHHLQRRRKRPMRGRRDEVLAHWDAPDLGNLFRNLGRRQHSAMPGLGALADLELHHLDLTVGCNAREFVRIEVAVSVAATEIAGSDLPDYVAAILAVIRADAALAGIVREAAFFRPRIERAYRVGAERAKAHRRNVEHRGRIRLAAIGAADGDAEFLAA